ncbi:Smad nuclear-interacting protein 1 [Trypanosoma theileri]|uniref:Smad nuclear-interacting protein 1 n=1 Tax=Trypanosoma theileri TaxID=67003 RepID=A0A1X0NZG4_9TRYP|nr:Smad nuclear-interacting protein 1 [Trypanosoma theileri]ORC90084.1 Smad nuclear-interacting protein 1 [Trypanosoma theileri]
MEKPFYGRTGALDNAHQGVPVSTTRFLSGKSAKWFPSLLTVPQRILHSITEGDGIECSIIRFLQLGCVYEELRRRHTDPKRHGLLLREILKWYQTLHRESEKSECLNDNRDTDLFQPFVPTYNLRVMKDDQPVGLYTAVTRRAVTLIGKDRELNDIPLDHPSCSAQHAALEVRFVYAFAEDLEQQFTTWLEGQAIDWNSVEDIVKLCVRVREIMSNLGDGEDTWSMELQVLDLGSTNGTRLNGEALQALQPTTLIEGDVLTFAFSSRKYVVVRS